MFGSELRAVMDAINESRARIEFTPAGKILDVNENFLKLSGYNKAELVGQHHTLLMPVVERDGVAHRQFWNELRMGQSQTREFKRVGKTGQEIWIQASYNPIRARNGKVVRIVKLASDITAQVARTLDLEGQIQSLHRSQAVIEFKLDGTIITANENFLATLGYSLGEIQGRHHRLFVASSAHQSAEYARHWQQLAAGKYISGEFVRYGKDGREVTIQGSYNPIFDRDVGRSKW